MKPDLSYDFAPSSNPEAHKDAYTLWTQLERDYPGSIISVRFRGGTFIVYTRQGQCPYLPPKWGQYKVARMEIPSPNLTK